MRIQDFMKEFNNNPALAKYQAAVGLANADIRNEISGAAITESEGKVLRSFLLDTSIENMVKARAKIAEAKNDLLRMTNSARRAAMLPEITDFGYLDGTKDRADLYID